MTSLLAMQPSTFLKKEDFPNPQRAQISAIKVETVGEGADATQKPILYLNGYTKGIALNKINSEILAMLFGDNIEAMIEKTVIVYTDPMVSFGGKLVGGIRIRADEAVPAPLAPPPQGQPAAPPLGAAAPIAQPTGAPATAPPPTAFDDDIPGF